MRIKSILAALAVCTTAFAAAATSFALGNGSSYERISADLTLLAKGELISVHFTPDFEETLSEREQIVYKALEKGVAAYTRRIDVSKAGYTDPTELTAFLETVFNTHPLWNGVDDQVTYTVKDGVITGITVDYTAADTMPTALSWDYTPTKTEIDHALADIKEGMTDVEKALILHDYLVREVDYSLAVQNGWDYSNDVYTLKGVFVDRIAVCQGYATAYSFLLSEVGVESMLVASDPMNHAWNLVKIDGNWYHVDVTWDDPTNGYEVDFCRGGFVRHEYFLRSDEEFLNEFEHYGWVNEETNGSAPAATVSNAFDGWSFRPMDNGEEGDVGMLNYVDGYFYCLPDVFGSNTMVKSKVDGSDCTEIPLFKNYEYLFYYDGFFYGSTQNEVHELTADGKMNRVVAAAAGQIRNFWLKQDVLAYYEVDEIGTVKKKTVDLVNGAVNRIEENGFLFLIDDDGNATILQYTGDPQSAPVIPQTVQGHPVTRIGMGAFKSTTNRGRIVIPEGVVSIADEAFMYSSYSEIVLPESLAYIGDFAFFNINYIDTITIPKNVNHIGRWAFYACYRLETAYFNGDVPEEWGEKVFGELEDQLEIKFIAGRKGWTDGTWVTPDGISHNSSSVGAFTMDVNGDGTVNAVDAAYLNMAIINPVEYPISIADCDFNMDGKTDAADASYLLWSLFKTE